MKNCSVVTERIRKTPKQIVERMGEAILKYPACHLEFFTPILISNKTLTHRCALEHDHKDSHLCPCGEEFF